jgi:hypothetical protein
VSTFVAPGLALIPSVEPLRKGRMASAPVVEPVEAASPEDAWTFSALQVPGGPTIGGNIPATTSARDRTAVLRIIGRGSGEIAS